MLHREVWYMSTMIDLCSRIQTYPPNINVITRFQYGMDEAADSIFTLSPIVAMTLSLLDAYSRRSLWTRKAALIYHHEDCRSFLPVLPVTIAKQTDNKIGWHAFLDFSSLLLLLVNFIDNFSIKRLIWLSIHQAVARNRTDKQRSRRGKSLVKRIIVTFSRKNKTQLTIIRIGGGTAREREKEVK